MSDDQIGASVTSQQQAYAYPQGPREQPSGGHGWLIVVGLVLALAVGGLAAAIISNGDEGSGTPTVVTKTAPSGTTVQSTTTVTTPAPNVTVAPDITLNPDGSMSSGQGSTSTTTSPTTTTSP
jgi:hypothetical protein